MHFLFAVPPVGTSPTERLLSMLRGAQPQPQPPSSVVGVTKCEKLVHVVVWGVSQSVQKHLKCIEFLL